MRPGGMREALKYGGPPAGPRRVEPTASYANLLPFRRGGATRIPPGQIPPLFWGAQGGTFGLQGASKALQKRI